MGVGGGADTGRARAKPRSAPPLIHLSCFSKTQAVPANVLLPYYDQRIVYSHAMLAFTGLDVYLAMADLDE